MAEFSKLQIRAKVLSVISQLKLLNDIKESDLDNFRKEFEPIEDKSAIFDIYVKEFIKMNDKDCVFSSFILKHLIPLNIISDKIFELLTSSNYSDEVKYKLVQLLRSTGAKFDYNTLPQYFDNPDEILDSDTKKLLESAVINPESMLDFIDFVYAVPNKDRIILVKSLKQDYTGDMLANIIYPLLYSDFDDSFLSVVVDILSESKSSLAIAPFNYLIDTSENEEIKNACKMGLKKLKLAGASIEKADEYFKNVLNNTKIAEMFTTIPDGNGNQAILITRVNQKKNYSLVAVVTNDVLGVIDTFGFFNVSRNELIRIIDKFYKSEGKYRVNEGYVKNKIDEAFCHTAKNKRTFPYEFICWSILLKDLQPLQNEISCSVNKNILKEDMINLLTKEYTFRWFLNLSDNEYLSELFEQLYNDETDDIIKINNTVKNYIDKIFDEETNLIWKNRITNTVNILMQNKKENEAVIFNSIPENEEIFELFKQILIQRSLFNGFYNLKAKLKETVFPVNIFKKNKQEEKKYDIKRIEAVIKILEKNWINE